MSEWTVDTLKELFFELRKDDKEGVENALKSLDARLAGLNELRGIVIDQQQTFVTRELHNSLDDKFVALEKIVAATSSKSQGAGVLAAWGLGLLGAAATLFNIFYALLK